jgi:hypothetical protein
VAHNLVTGGTSRNLIASPSGDNLVFETVDIVGDVTFGSFQVVGWIVQSEDAVGAVDMPAALVNGYVVNRAANLELIKGTLLPLPALQVSGSIRHGPEDIVGAVTMPGLEVSGTVPMHVLITSAVTMPALAASGTLNYEHTLTGDVLLPSLAVEAKWIEITTAVVTLAALQVSGDVDVWPRAVGAPTLAALEVSGAIVREHIVSGMPSFPALEVSGVTPVHRLIDVQGTPSMGAVAVSGAGSSTTTHDAPGTPTLGTLEVSGALEVYRIRTITSAVDMPALTVAGVGQHEFPVSPVSITVGALVVDGSINKKWTGTSAVDLPAVTVSGAIYKKFTASGTPALPALAVSGALADELQGTSAVALPALAVSGSIHIEQDAPGAVTLGAVTVSGTCPVITTREIVSSPTMPALEVGARVTIASTLERQLYRVVGIHYVPGTGQQKVFLEAMTKPIDL